LDGEATPAVDRRLIGRPVVVQVAAVEHGGTHLTKDLGVYSAAGADSRVVQPAAKII
jgi:hypothetical protein